MRPALPSQSRRHIDQGECLLYMQLCKTLPCCYFISQLFLLPTLRLLLLAQPIVDYSVYEERPTSPCRLALLNKATVYYCSCFNDGYCYFAAVSDTTCTYQRLPNVATSIYLLLAELGEYYISKSVYIHTHLIAWTSLPADVTTSYHALDIYWPKEESVYSAYMQLIKYSFPADVTISYHALDIRGHLHGQRRVSTTLTCSCIKYSLPADVTTSCHALDIYWP